MAWFHEEPMLFLEAAFMGAMTAQFLGAELVSKTLFVLLLGITVFDGLRAIRRWWRETEVLG